MTNLSPAAQAVMDAAQFEVNAECHAPWIAAAVIRAVADQWRKETKGKSRNDFFRGIERCIEAATEIATELEGQ